jgi:hypothetical protein
MTAVLFCQLLQQKFQMNQHFETSKAVSVGHHWSLAHCSHACLYMLVMHVQLQVSLAYQ